MHHSVNNYMISFCFVCEQGQTLINLIVFLREIKLYLKNVCGFVCFGIYWFLHGICDDLFKFESKWSSKDTKD